MSAPPITPVRYISRSRLALLPTPHLDRYRPDAADGEVIGRSYDIVTDVSTDWIVVADTDARAETVTFRSRYNAAMDADTRARLRRLVLQQREIQRQMFTAQSEAIANIRGMSERFAKTLDAIQRMHDDMMPLFETINEIDDVIKDE